MSSFCLSHILNYGFTYDKPPGITSKVDLSLAKCEWLSPDDGQWLRLRQPTVIG